MKKGSLNFVSWLPGNIHSVYQVMGYKTQEKTITVSAEATSVVHFQMEEESFMTDEVVVSAQPE